MASLEGYIAAKLEEELSRCILKDTGIEKGMSIYQLFLLSDGNCHFLREYTSGQIEKVNRNWDRLEQDIGMDHEIYSAIEALKSIYSQSNLSLVEISNHIKSDVSRCEQDKNMICRLVAVLDSLMQYS